MRALAVALLGISLASCATDAPRPIETPECLNWLPHITDKNGRRLDVTPHSVLIQIDKNLETTLLALLPERPNYSAYCWYRKRSHKPPRFTWARHQESAPFIPGPSSIPVSGAARCRRASSLAACSEPPPRSPCYGWNAGFNGRHSERFPHFQSPALLLAF